MSEAENAGDKDNEALEIEGNTSEQQAEAEIENKDAKISILLKATGNVPILKKKVWQVEPDRQVSWITKWVHKYLKLDPEEKLFLYVNKTFAPSPDQTVRNLYECHATDGKLIFYYSKSQAWG